MKIGILTSGGLAPCLSAAISMLIKQYSAQLPNCSIILYLNGYKGLRDGDSIEVTQNIIDNIDILLKHGGSPIGNSRVKLTNIAEKENHASYKEISAQLLHDKIDILHVVGGDDTNTTAAALVKYLEKIGKMITIIGLPKTIDNDIFPIARTLGSQTAADNSAKFFSHIVHENTAHPRTLIVHVVMGRNSGWLTAKSAYLYREGILKNNKFMPEIGLHPINQDIHAVFLPEMSIDLEYQARRLKIIMDKYDNANIFVAEGAGLTDIQNELRSKAIETDAFGNIKLEKINTGEWFGDKIGKIIRPEKILIQKSGYFARSGPPNQSDLSLIKLMVDEAVLSAINRKSGVIGHDEEDSSKLSVINFNRIKGEKKFDLKTSWFTNMMNQIDQKI